MKIRDMLIVGFLVISFICFYGLAINVESVGFLLALMVGPYAIMWPLYFRYFTYSKILKEAGNDEISVKTQKLSAVVGVTFLLLMLLGYVYFNRLNLGQGYVLDSLTVGMVAISHAIMLSTAIFTGLAAYNMYVKMIARGYKKLLK